MTADQEINHIPAGTGWKERWKKIGLVGFLLFLLKGIIWLVVGYFLRR